MARRTGLPYDYRWIFAFSGSPLEMLGPPHACDNTFCVKTP